MFVIGGTSQPWEGDLKSLSSCFHRRLFLPYPQYSSVLMLWKTALADVLRPYKRHLPAEFDVSSLAHISIGCVGSWACVLRPWRHSPAVVPNPRRYSAGSIVKAVKATMTERRIDRLDKRPLTEAEFIQALSRCPRTFNSDNKQFRKFTDAITGLEVARNAVRDAAAGDDDGGKGKKGKKGKGKKKKK